MAFSKTLSIFHECNGYLGSNVCEQLILMVTCPQFLYFPPLYTPEVHQESEELGIICHCGWKETQNPEMRSPNDKLIGTWELLSGHKQ